MIRMTIDKNDAGQRLDRFLRKYLHNAPLSAIYKMIRKDVKVNGKRAEQKTVLQEQDELFLYISEEDLQKYTERSARRPVSVRKTFRVIHEDRQVLIVNKPAGLLTHGDSREKKNTLVNQVTDYLIQKGDYQPRREKTFSPAAANRLDRNTSGMVLFGKDAQTLRTLSAMIRERDRIEKHYLTVVRGDFPEHRVLTGSTAKDESRNQVKISRDSSEHGREIITEVTPVVSNGEMTLLDIHLITGRTHQIRAHLASEGYPVAGDSKYGDRELNKKLLSDWHLQSQFLHAYRLNFKEAPSPLERLSGQSFVDPLPPVLDRMACSLFGEEWKSIYQK